MPKPIPPVTVAASIPPDFERTYFEECDRYPFSSRAVAFHPANAWWMAEASLAAYGAFEETAPRKLDLSRLLAVGFRIEARTRGEMQFLVIENAEVLIIAFRGTRLEGFNIPFFNGQAFTANWRDVITDARFTPSLIATDTFVHAGFHQAFQTIESDLDALIQRALSDQRPVWFCGHSLGGALATLAAHKYRDRAQGLYTFGSPRVGNASFARILDERLPNIHRFVHHRDIVTTVPPERFTLPASIQGWKEIFHNLRSSVSAGYTHTGKLKYISGGKTWKIEDGISAEVSLTALAADALVHAKEIADVLAQHASLADPGSWPVLYDAIVDHSPVYYANKLFNACEEVFAGHPTFE